MSEETPRRRSRKVAAISDKGADAAPALRRPDCDCDALRAEVSRLTAEVEKLSRALAAKSAR